MRTEASTRAVVERPDHYDHVTGKAPRLRRFYYQDLYGFIRREVTPGARVLDLGCGDGRLLASLAPSVGVGVDHSLAAIEEATRTYPHLDFVHGDIEDLTVEGQFDYIIVSNTIGYTRDVWSFLRQLRDRTHAGTRLIVMYYNFLWEPMLRLAEVLRLKPVDPPQNWLSRADLLNLCGLAGFEPIASGYRTPIPIGPGRIMKSINNFLSTIPLLRKLGITCYVIARRVQADVKTRRETATCSVVIPTRNEKGNIAGAFERVPEMGDGTEIIFVDGNSTDGTAAEIERLIQQFAHRDVRLLHQGDGVGKGDAVRKGFAVAKNDILMILDADLTVPPEDLPKFYWALVEEQGEFINGTRLVYPLEKGAMRIANIFGNKLFGLAFTWILEQRITDTLCGTKVLWADAYDRIAEGRHELGDFDPFGDFDLLFGASRLRLRLKEVPIRYQARSYGQTNISRWRHGWLLLKMAIRGARVLRFR
jgi:SAM-dependent methyltransferase